MGKSIYKKSNDVNNFNADFNASGLDTEHFNELLRKIGIKGEVIITTTTDLLKWRTFLEFCLTTVNELSIKEIETLNQKSWK